MIGLIDPRNTSDSASETVKRRGAACFTTGTFFSHFMPATFLSEKARARSNAPATLLAPGRPAMGLAIVTLGWIP